MDTLMPKEWQPYIKEGIEAWNEAFEKIGFKDVVRVMDFPKDDPDFNANNIKYSTIRYAPLWLDMQNSMHVDPRTGEIHVYYDIDYQGILTYGVTGFPHTYFIDSQGNLQLYAPGMISAAGLQQGLHSISPDLVPAPES